MRALLPDSLTTQEPREGTPQIAIIGSGFAGLLMGIRLKQAGIDTFTIYEKQDSVGGVWRDNTYPGAACDVPSHLYSYSFYPKHDWTRAYSPQPEILDYLEDCADHYGLHPYIRFGTEIASADWDSGTCKWTLETTTGETATADVLVPACGQLSQPAYPDIAGRDEFAGAQFHSARWNHEADLAGKTVAVVGTGASAIQFVPEVAREADRVYVFQRSPAWVLPRPDGKYADRVKRAFRTIPGIRQAHRSTIYLTLESQLIAMRGGPMGAIWKQLAVRNLDRWIDDPALRAKLTPDYQIGCKRTLISNDWYRALAKDHVEVITDEIAQIYDAGLRTENGDEYPVDAIIYGTGFKTTEFLAPMQITGRDGTKLNDAWQGGAEAYLGMTVPGFPNMFMLYGPNTNLGHNSIVFMLECQAGYALQAVEALAQGDAASLDVRESRMRTYNDDLQSELDATVWASGCDNWYTNAGGKNTNNWPGWTLAYKQRTRTLEPSDFETLVPTPDLPQAVSVQQAAAEQRGTGRIGRPHDRTP